VGAFRIAVVARTAAAVVARTAEDFRIVVVARTVAVVVARTAEDFRIAVVARTAAAVVARTPAQCCIAAADCKPAKPAALIASGAIRMTDAYDR
jgi:hypothetical protein